MAKKAGLRGDSGDYLNWYCIWGTFFEDVTTEIVALDLGTPVWGTSIHVPSPFAGHANSPDGYGIVWIVPRSKSDKGAKSAVKGTDTNPWVQEATAVNTDLIDQTGEWRLWMTDEGARPASAVPVPVLFEFKSPPARVPGVQGVRKKKGPVPLQYVPQIWSGLEVAAAGAGVRMGLFVDAAFRACSLRDVGFTPGFNATLHRKKTNPPGWAVGAWASGVIWFYGAEAVTDAGGKPEIRDLGGRDEEMTGGVPLQFDNFCRMVHVGALVAVPGRAALADGRGCTLAAAATPPPMKRDDPKHPYLVGGLGWKLFHLEYAPVPRRPGFLEEIRPLIDSVLGEAHEIAKTPDPENAWRGRYAADDIEMERALLSELSLAPAQSVVVAGDDTPNYSAPSHSGPGHSAPSRGLTDEDALALAM